MIVPPSALRSTTTAIAIAEGHLRARARGRPARSEAARPRRRSPRADRSGHRSGTLSPAPAPGQWIATGRRDRAGVRFRPWRSATPSAAAGAAARSPARSRRAIMRRCGGSAAGQHRADTPPEPDRALPPGVRHHLGSRRRLAPGRTPVQNARYVREVRDRLDEVGALAMIAAKFSTIYGARSPPSATAEPMAMKRPSPIPAWVPLIGTPNFPEYPCGVQHRRRGDRRVMSAETGPRRAAVTGSEGRPRAAGRCRSSPNQSSRPSSNARPSSVFQRGGPADRAPRRDGDRTVMRPLPRSRGGARRPSFRPSGAPRPASAERIGDLEGGLQRRRYLPCSTAAGWRVTRRSATFRHEGQVKLGVAWWSLLTRRSPLPGLEDVQQGRPRDRRQLLSV